MRRPQGAVDALATMGLSIPSVAVRVFAAAGSVLGLVALVTDGGAAVRLVAVLVGLAYLGFAGFVGLALARGDPLASCGCFGSVDTPPNLNHLTLNLVGVVAALAVALWPGGGLRGSMARQPGAGLPFLFMTGVCAGLAYLVFTLAPGHRSRASRGGARPRG